jgi:hypothetical protein
MTDTKTARIHLSDEGAVIVRVRDGAYQSLDDAKMNLATAVAEGRGRRRPLLIDIRSAPVRANDGQHLPAYHACRYSDATFHGRNTSR